jgi:hypothetical protein
MPDQHKQSRRTKGRRWSRFLLALIPALAIVALGTSLSLPLGGPATESGLQVAKTRTFAAQGDAVTATSKPVDQGSVDGFMDSWQNTVRVPPSPRR